MQSRCLLRLSSNVRNVRFASASAEWHGTLKQGKGSLSVPSKVDLLACSHSTKEERQGKEQGKICQTFSFHFGPLVIYFLIIHSFTALSGTWACTVLPSNRHLTLTLPPTSTPT
eukprot:EG_transcript_49598